MKVAVNGAAGRMGRRIMALAAASPNVMISAGIETTGHPLLGEDIGELAGIGKIGVMLTDNREEAIQNCDVLIDFSSPAASVANIESCAAMGKAIVVGTTGFNDEQREQIKNMAGKTRCIVAPNMSRGVNVLFKITERVTKALGPDYDVEIVEAHHKLKKDSPSGTADKLAHIVADTLNRDLAEAGVYGRKGIVGERKPEEIGVFAVRGGDIVGEHTVMFVTNGERIELIHRAHSRDAFASGAVQAAMWLYSQPNGLYDMMDVLGLKD